MTQKEQYSKITDPPRTVKEAIDWLLRIGRKDDTYKDDNSHSQTFCDAVKALLGTNDDKVKTEFDKLIKSLEAFIGWKNKPGGGSPGPSQETGQISGNGIVKAGYKSSYKLGEDKSMFKKCSEYKSNGGSCCEPKCSHCKANQECPPGGCCDNCPARKCARIFCLIVPVLLTLFDYLKSRIEGSYKGAKSWAGENLSSGTSLHNFFIQCGFDVRNINATQNATWIGNNINDALLALENTQESIAEAFSTNAATRDSQLSPPHFSNGTKLPTTIRDMMLWLCGLPYCSVFAKLKQTFRALHDEIKRNNTGVKDIFSFYHLMNDYADTITWFPKLLCVIEGSMSHMLKDLMNAQFAGEAASRFKYDSNPNVLLTQFLEYVYKVYIQLRFLYDMCKTETDAGGWRDCLYGNGLQECQNCNKDEDSKKCDQPLHNFLIGDDTHNRFTWKNGDTVIKMGFGAALSTPMKARKASQLLVSLEELFGSQKPLEELCKCLVSLSNRQPQSLGDSIDLFIEIASTQDNIWDADIKAHLEKELKQYFGTDARRHRRDLTQTDAAATHLKQIGECIKLVSGTEQHNQGSHASTPEVNNLLLLLGCSGIKGTKCPNYVKTLTSGVYQYFVPSLAKPQSQKWLEWLFKHTMDLYKRLEQLRDELYSCKCCPSGNTTKCQGIVECPHCLPTLYKFGLVFGDASTLKSEKKKCSELMHILTNMIETDAPVFLACSKILEKVQDILLARLMKLNAERFTTAQKAQLKAAYDVYIKSAMRKAEAKLRETYLGTREHDDIDDYSTSENYKGIKRILIKSISANIPEYRAPQIDPFRYYDYTTGTQPYKFTHAIDFHIPKANCLKPPTNLRSVIDWLLRVTVGDTKPDKNADLNNICDAISQILGNTTDTATIGTHMESLVTVLRGFVGYTNNDSTVITDVDKMLKKVHEGVNTAKRHLEQYLNVYSNYSKELGKALLKAPFTVGGEQQKFTDTIKIFNEKLKEEHTSCPDNLDCKTVEFKEAKNSHDLPNGLDILCLFFTSLIDLVKFGEDIGKLMTQDQTTKASLHSMELFVSREVLPGTHGGENVFTKIKEALKKLGGCATTIRTLNINNPNGQGMSNFSGFKDNIKSLLTALNTAVNVTLKGVPVDMVQDACTKLVLATKKKVEIDIIGVFVTGIIEVYTRQSAYDMNIDDLLHEVEGVIQPLLPNFQYHIDHLKTLCQWSHKVGLLFDGGLTNFVKALIQHFGHIYGIICDMENLEEKINELRNITEVGHIKGTVEELFQDINNAINNLLGSYVLGPLPEGNSDKTNDTQNVEQRRRFLHDLRLLALDRYTLQVWQDECNPNGGRQSAIKDWITFEGGIIRHSDLSAIKAALQNLTGITYNNASSSATGSPSAPAPAPAPRSRIHDFHAICVIQKFSFEAPLTKLERSLKELKGIQGQLSGVKQKCNGGTDVSSDGVVTTFCDSVSQFLKDPYGIYSFAKFVHTIMGPNVFSAVIGALEHLKSANELNGQNDVLKIKATNFYKSVEGLLEGPEREFAGGPRDTDYKLDEIIKKLESFITTLKREYIFAYPVVTATASQAIASPPNPQPTIPTCPNRDHSTSSICQHCYHYLAKIFIGAIPNLYRHCRLLYEMCNLDVNKKATWNNDNFEFNKNGVYRYKDGYLSLGGYMSRNGWIVKGLNEEMDKKGLYELDPNGGGYLIHGNLYDVVSSIYPLEESNKDSLQPLDQLFKAVMQHFKDERKKKRKQREEQLKQKFEENPNNKGIPFQAPPAPLPSTVRQVLFWLHELDTNKAFYDQMSQHINTLCTKSRIGISHDTILHVLKLSATQCLEVLATIEDPGRQNAQYYYELYTEEHYYDYPTVNIPLFFYTFVEKLMAAFLELNFVCVQCEFRATEGGWKDCEIGKAHQGAYEVQGSVCCICHERKTVGTPIHAVTVSGSVVCPRPLSAFLFSDQKNQLKVPMDPTLRLPYMSKGTMPCGFQLKNKASTDAATQGDAQSAPTPAPTYVSGSVLVEPLKKLVGGHVTGRHSATTKNALNTLSTVIYLRDLLRYVLCLAVRPPWSMSENMAFFYRVTESWKQKGVGSARVALRNDKLLRAIHDEIALFPGTFDGERLTSAVERFAGLEDKERHNGTNGTHSNTSHQFDLRTLMGCQEKTTTGTSAATATAQCSPFIFPLSLDVYTHFDHRNSRAYLSWILNFAFGIYGQLKTLEEMIKGSACVRNGSKSNSNCPSLPMCPGVLTALYQSGSSFMDQKVLADVNTSTVGVTTTKKTCNDFHSVLSGLFNCDSAYCTPLHNLIVQCEAFLWSIRLPFSLVQLSLWSVAILFISYVFVVPLDHFKIKSHLFNRLKYTMHPSLLIADSQRRVSEVAYFSL